MPMHPTWRTLISLLNDTLPSNSSVTLATRRQPARVAALTLDLTAAGAHEMIGPNEAEAEAADQQAASDRRPDDTARYINILHILAVSAPSAITGRPKTPSRAAHDVLLSETRPINHVTTVVGCNIKGANTSKNINVQVSFDIRVFARSSDDSLRRYR